MKTLMKREQALKIMADYYKENKDKYPRSIRKFREEIISSIMNGKSPQETFDSI